jgi:hypothetical protein
MLDAPRGVTMEHRAWGVHTRPERGLEMVDKHHAGASASAPTMTQYAAVLSILAAFALGVLALMGIL